MKKRKSLYKIYISAVLSGLFIHNSPIMVLAEEVYTAADGNQVEDSRLNDQMIEYDELGSLIHNFNGDVKNDRTEVEARRAEYTEAKELLQFEKSDAHYKKARAKEDGDTEEYTEQSSEETTYKEAIDSYDDMLKSLDRYSSNEGWLKTEKELTCEAQQTMISYQSAVSQKSYAVKLEQVYSQLYEAEKLSHQAGLATSQDVESAYNSWMSAKISADTLASQEESLYKSLCITLGVDDSGSMTVASIPAVDLSRLDGLDLEKDTQTAVDSNPDVISARTSSSVGSTAVQNKAREENSLSEQVRQKMKELYEAVQQANTSYNSTKAGYSSAEITWNNAQSKNSMGMLSKADYLQAEADYLQKKSAYEAADLSLLQALENYYWAVRGIVELD